jgi:NitT/TauT family transport system permease protein
MRQVRRGLRTALPPLLFFLAFAAAWQVAVVLLEIPPFLLPGPLAIVAAALENGPTLLSATGVTAAGALAGFTLSQLVGLLIAFAFAEWELVRRAGYPYAIFLQTVPIVAIAPLLVIWSGYEFRTVVLVTLIISLFPIINSVADGLLAIPQDRLDLFRLYGASRLQTLWRLRIPTAVHYLMLGAKTSSGLAVIGAIVAEFFVGSGGANYSGLGTLMTGWQTLGRTAPLMAALCISTLIGVIMFGSVELLSRTVLRRWMSYE